MEDFETTGPVDQTPETPAWPPYEPPTDAVVFDDVELLDADGAPQGCIIASAYFADYYCTYVMPGWSWRHYMPPEPDPGPPTDEAPPDASPTDVPS